MTHNSESGSALARVVACRTVCAKPLHEPTPTYCHFGPKRRNKLQRNLNRNSNTFIQENVVENAVCKMAATLSREDSVGQMFLAGAGGWLYDKCKLSITSVIVIQQVFAIGNATFIHVWKRRLYVSVIEICLCPLLSQWQVSWPTGFLITWTLNEAGSLPEIIDKAQCWHSTHQYCLHETFIVLWKRRLNN